MWQETSAQNQSRDDSSAAGHYHKKPGRRNGHEGKARKRPDHIDANVTIDRKEYARCGSRLSRPTGSYERIAEDIVPATTGCGRLWEGGL
ncbi:MAG: hypothetical protein QW177_08300 [Candidatus Nitrosotenuis sp.]